MNAVSIGFLADAPRHVGVLADCHHAEWASLYSDWTRACAEAELADHATRRTSPTTLVASDGGALLGSVSLVLEDVPELSHFGSPWLASLYVLPAHRGRAVGKSLVAALVTHAGAQGIETLRLFTARHADYYRRLGWQSQAHVELNGTPVSVMSIAPRRLPS